MREDRYCSECIQSSPDIIAIAVYMAAEYHQVN
jgi:hypothetical protein